MGDRIRWLIEKKMELSQADFARQSGFHRQQLSQWINDPEKPPGKKNLQKLADIGGVTEAWLAYGIEAENVSRETENLTAAVVHLLATDPEQVRELVDLLMDPKIRALWDRE